MSHTPALLPAAFEVPARRVDPGRSDVGPLRDLLRLLGASDAAANADGGIDLGVFVKRAQEGDTLYGEGTRVDAFYFVRAGTFKAFNTGEDGYEQVVGFASRGESLGFEAIGIGRFGNEAVALEDSSVYVVPLRSYLAQGSRCRALDEGVFRAISLALLRRQELAHVMAAVAAEVRLARFLTHLSQRMQSVGQSPRCFHLRMNRREIASYLGVAHETISRSFTAMAGMGLLKVNNREVEILDMERLKTFASATRRAVDEAPHPSARACGITRPRGESSHGASTLSYMAAP